MSSVSKLSVPSKETSLQQISCGSPATHVEGKSWHNNKELLSIKYDWSLVFQNTYRS